MDTKHEFYLPPAPPAALKRLGAASKHVFVVAMFAAALAFAGCGGGGDDDDVYVPGTPDPSLPKTVTEKDLTPHILAPASGGTLAVSFHPKQYDLKSVEWAYTASMDPVEGSFAPGGTYTVTAELKPITGWNLNTVTDPDFFQHDYADPSSKPPVASVKADIKPDEEEEEADDLGDEAEITVSSNPYYNTGNKLVVISFVPAKTTVTDLVLTGYITAPVNGVAPKTSFPASDEQYTAGEVAWVPPVSGTFAPATAYIAAFKLTAKEGYTFVGIPAKTSEAQVVGVFTHKDGKVTHDEGVKGTLEVRIDFPATLDDDANVDVNMEVPFE
jgi:hypothetical protein